MATTSRGIVTPNQTDEYNLITDLNTMATSIDEALQDAANTYRGTSSERTQFTSEAPEGTIWVDTNGEKIVWVKQGISWVNLQGVGRVVSENLSPSRGYIRFADGRQEAWVSLTASVGGTLWSSGIYYSDVSMGNWAISFSRLDHVVASIRSTLYWATPGNQTNSSAGVVRGFRPTAPVSSVTVAVRGWGIWE